MLRARASVKALVERMAATAARMTFARQKEPQSLVLAFHNVVPDAAADGLRGDASLHLPVSRFTAMLDALCALPHVALASHPAVGEPPTSGAASARVNVLVTFDDAYRGALRHALPVLAARGGAAVVFVAPALLGIDHTWWDALSPGRTEAGEAAWWSERERVLAPPACGLQERILIGDAHTRRFAQGGAAAEDLGIATLAELEEACAAGGVTLACHSSRHACLPSLDTDAIVDELRTSLAWLEASGLPWVRWHAFPYGRWSDAVVAALHDLDYEAAFLVEPTPVARHAEFLHPRLNVPAGMSPDGLIWRLSKQLRA